MSHRYAAILAADVAHYSRHMERDSEATVSALKDCRAAFRECVSAHGGREFGSVGDSLMAEFPSAVEALRAARECQTKFAELRPVNAGGDHLSVRIGLDAGDVIDDGRNLFGDVVNTAARLQAIARPGGIVLSAFIHQQVHKEPGFAFRSLGKQQLKNILEPVVVYEVGEAQQTFNTRRLQLALGRYVPALAATAGVIVAGLLFVGYLEMREQPGIAGTIEVQPPNNSIAVLPFQIVGLRGDSAPLAEGIHADLVAQLSKLSALERVISRASVQRYRNSQLSIREIGQALAVTTILEGSVQQLNDRVRVNVELIDALTDDLLWAETYDRELTAENLFAIQSDVTREITAALHINLSDEESGRLRAVPTASLEAYGEYSRGLEEESKRTPAALHRAEAHFRAAIDIDADFALAYVGAADALYLQSEYDPANSDPATQERQKLIERALSIDPLSGEAYTSLAWLQQGTDNPDEVEQLFRRAIDLSPGYPRAYHWYGAFLAGQGRREEAIAEFWKALELAPDESIIRIPLSSALANLGRYDDALDVLLEGVKRNPYFHGFYSNIAFRYEYSGSWGEALRWAEAGRAVAPRDVNMTGRLCGLRLRLKYYDDAEQCLHFVESEYGEVPYRGRLQLYFNRGEFGLARSLLHDVAQLKGFGKRDRLIVAVYSLQLGEILATLDILRSIEPSLFADNGEFKKDLGFDVAAPKTKQDLGIVDQLLVMYLVGATYYQLGDVGLANPILDELLEILRAAREVDRNAGDPGAWVSPMNEVPIHAIRQNAPMVIESIRNSIYEPYFGWFGEEGPMFDFIRDDPGWIELMDEIESRVARERQYYAQHKDEPLF